MSTGVMITLIICLTIILLFGTIMIAGVVISKQKKRDQVNDYTKNDFPTIEDFQNKDGKY